MFKREIDPESLGDSKVLNLFIENLFDVWNLFWYLFVKYFVIYLFI